MANDDFKEVKKLTKGRIEKLEKQLNDLASVGTEIRDLVASALKKAQTLIDAMKTMILKKKG